MFVPVACPKCGKPFQVADASVGQSVACPWCAASVLALPVAEPVAAQPEPLSLDDDSPLPAPRALPRWPITAAIVVGVMVGVGGLTFAVLRLTKFEGEWTTFTPPDESCSVLMPTPPKTERPDRNPYSAILGDREWFVAERRGRKVTFGWAELFAERAKLVRPEDLLDAEIRHRKDSLRATSATRPAPVRVNDFQGAEVNYETPNGTRAELLLVVESGPKPRLYVMAVEGKGVKLDDPVVRRFFNSLRFTP
jgi:hypothetical protein